MIILFFRYHLISRVEFSFEVPFIWLLRIQYVPLSTDTLMQNCLQMPYLLSWKPLSALSPVVDEFSFATISVGYTIPRLSYAYFLSILIFWFVHFTDNRMVVYVLIVPHLNKWISIYFWLVGHAGSNFISRYSGALASHCAFWQMVFLYFQSLVVFRMLIQDNVCFYSVLIESRYCKNSFDSNSSQSQYHSPFRFNHIRRDTIFITSGKWFSVRECRKLR